MAIAHGARHQEQSEEYRAHVEEARCTTLGLVMSEVGPASSEFVSRRIAEGGDRPCRCPPASFHLGMAETILINRMWKRGATLKELVVELELNDAERGFNLAAR